MGGLAAFTLPAPPIGAQELSTLRASPDPILSIGIREADSPYELFQLGGAVRFSDGSVVVVSRGHFEVRKFDSGGSHLWSRGREGGGPAEFQLPELLPTCSSENRIVVYDRLNARFTIFDGVGKIVDEYRVQQFAGQGPYSTIKCTASGRMVFTRFADASQRPNEPGSYRWTMDMAYFDGDDSPVTVFRSEIPGTDRYVYFEGDVMRGEGPLTWGRDVCLAPADEGVWMGTGDRPEIELIDWTGTTLRRIEWSGADQAVTQAHIDLYRQDLYDWYERGGRENWRQIFEGLWEERRPALPDRFPSHNTIMTAGDLVWVKEFRQPGKPEHHWRAFDATGRQVAEMLLPMLFVVEQIGPDWVMAKLTDELGIEKIVIHSLVEDSLDGQLPLDSRD